MLLRAQKQGWAKEHFSNSMVSEMTKPQESAEAARAADTDHWLDHQSSGGAELGLAGGT